MISTRDQASTCQGTDYRCHSLLDLETIELGRWVPHILRHVQIIIPSEIAKLRREPCLNTTRRLDNRTSTTMDSVKGDS